MKISYVLPVYNQENTVAQCIESLLCQKNEESEIIVINDGSTDYTGDVISHFAISDYGIKYHYNMDRLGAAKCRNFGNDISTGDIIAVCDADIYYKSRGEAIEDFFKSNPDMDLFCSALHYRESHEPPQHKYIMEAYNWDYTSKCPISHPTVAYRRKVIEKVQYQEKSIDTDLYEFFLLDCHKAGFKMNGCQDPLMYKIEGNSNRKSKKAKKLKQKMYKQYGIEVEM